MYGRPKSMARGQSLEDPLVVRVQLENVGYIGFVYLTAETKLDEVRRKIVDEIEGAPMSFTFLMEERIPIARSQEPDITAVTFYPMVCMIRASKAPEQSSSKVVVHSSNKPDFKTWITGECRFGQLRADAARFWDLDPNAVILKDGEGYAWPEEATIESVLPHCEGRQPVIHLHPKPSSGRANDSASAARSAHDSTEIVPIGGGGGAQDFDTAAGRALEAAEAGAYLTKQDPEMTDYEQELWLMVHVHAVTIHV